MAFFEGIVAAPVSESALAYCRLIDSFAAAAGKDWGVDITESGPQQSEPAWVKQKLC